MANSPTFAPWALHPNRSSTSLSRLGLEKAVPPAQSVPALLPADKYARKELPPIPNQLMERSHRRPLSDQSLGGLDPKKKNSIRSQYNKRIYEPPRPQVGSKSHSLPESMARTTRSPHRQLSADSSSRVLPPPPPPPMTKSAQKILQLTGFDPTFDREIVSHSSVSPESSESSGSQYSQPESEIQDYGTVQSSHGEVTPMTFTCGEPSVAYLQSSTYSISERSASASSLSVAAVASASVPTSLRVHDRVGKSGPKRVDLTGEDFVDGLTNKEFMANEMVRYERQKQRRSRFDNGFERDVGRRYGAELPDASRRDLVPQPLAIRSKPSVDAENRKLVRHYTAPASPIGRPYDGMPVGTRTPGPPMPRPRTKRSFGSGKHLLKSPFPLTSSQKDSESGEGEQRFRKKFSGAMKRWSGGRRSPVKQTVISPLERKAEEYDTSMPSNFGLKSLIPSEMIQKGNDHLQDAVDKARKGLKIKTADEKRREDIKKQIVVVGVMDQSPDGRVSEWF